MKTANPQSYYVQKRDVEAERWVSIDVAEDLCDGATRAARALPANIRLISQSQLSAEGGQESIMRAAADLWQH